MWGLSFESAIKIATVQVVFIVQYFNRVCVCVTLQDERTLLESYTYGCCVRIFLVTNNNLSRLLNCELLHGILQLLFFF